MEAILEAESKVYEYDSEVKVPTSKSCDGFSVGAKY